MISVERIMQYSKIASEAPLLIEDHRPPNNWPEIGTICFKNLQVSLNANINLRKRLGSLFIFIFLFLWMITILYWIDCIVDTLRRASSLCPEEYRLYLSREEENWSCGKDREWEIDAHTSHFQDCRAPGRKHCDRWCGHNQDRSPRLKSKAKHYSTRPDNVRRNCQRKPWSARAIFRLWSVGGKQKTNSLSSKFIKFNTCFSITLHFEHSIFQALEKCQLASLVQSKEKKLDATG